MTSYSVQPRDWIFVKGYGFLSFAKNMGKNIGKNISKSLSGKCNPGMLVMCQKRFDYAKQSATDIFKISPKTVIQKTAETTGGLTGKKIANKITKVPKKLEIVTNENDKEIPKERYMSPENNKKLLIIYD